MTIQQTAATVSNLEASRLKVTLADTLNDIQSPDNVIFGQYYTDHMLIATYDPSSGWSAPEIRPYSPIVLDPASSCLHYCSSVFEGMKAYRGPDGKPRLFRPRNNIERLARSAARVVLPPFDVDALLTLIERLVVTDARWIPSREGHSLYVRPTIIGTRPSIDLAPSNYATLFVIMTPVGPYFRGGVKPVSLLALTDFVRAWPGGTGDYKLGSNYAAGFFPQQIATKKGYQQVLYLFGEERYITEAGGMNFFVAVSRPDGVVEVITPPLDGTILPGITRDSCLELLKAHIAGTIHLPKLDPSARYHVEERAVQIVELQSWLADGSLLEAFLVGTAAVVAPVGRIGFADGKPEIQLPQHETAGPGPIASALLKRVVEIQEGKVEWDGWSVQCE